MSSLADLQKIIDESNNIVFFGGAGVSTESGIPDFRSSNGLFNEKLNITFTPEQLVSHSFYIRYPEEFFNFYKASYSFLYAVHIYTLNKDYFNYIHLFNFYTYFVILIN